MTKYYILTEDELTELNHASFKQGVETEACLRHTLYCDMALPDPIELPSEEEIKKVFPDDLENSGDDDYDNLNEANSFRQEGANYILNLLLKNNKCG